MIGKAPMKKTSVKKAAKKTSKRQADASATKSKPLIGKQPQSKEKAALQAGIFLYTNDIWAAAYFKDGDLHAVERELFGSAA